MGVDARSWMRWMTGAAEKVEKRAVTRNAGGRRRESCSGDREDGDDTES